MDNIENKLTRLNAIQSDNDPSEICCSLMMTIATLWLAVAIFINQSGLSGIGHLTASFRVYARHHRIGDAKGQVIDSSVSMLLFADTSQMGYSSFRLKCKTIWN